MDVTRSFTILMPIAYAINGNGTPTRTYITPIGYWLPIQIAFSFNMHLLSCKTTTKQQTPSGVPTYSPSSVTKNSKQSPARG